MSELSQNASKFKEQVGAIIVNRVTAKDFKNMIVDKYKQGVINTFEYHIQNYKNQLNHYKNLLIFMFRQLQQVDKTEFDSLGTLLFEASLVLSEIQAYMIGFYQDINVRYYNAKYGQAIVADMTREQAYKNLFVNKDIGANMNKFKGMNEFKQNTKINNQRLNKMIERYVLKAVEENAATGTSPRINYRLITESKTTKNNKTVNYTYKIVRTSIADEYPHLWSDKSKGEKKRFNEGHLYEAFDQTAYDINNEWHAPPNIKAGETRTSSLNNLVEQFDSTKFRRKFFGKNLKRDNVKANIAGDVNLMQIKSNSSHMADANFYSNRIYENLRIISELQTPQPNQKEIEKFLRNLIPDNLVEQVAADLIK